jgi:hypothetical protein
MISIAVHRYLQFSVVESFAFFYSSLSGFVVLWQGKAQLLELLTQVQLEVDGIKSDESVRPHRKSQTNRIQALILALEKAGHATTKVKESSHLQSTSVSNLST